MKNIFLICICAIFTGCATYTGDKLVSLTYLSPKPGNHANLLKVEEMILKLYDELALPEKRKISIDSILTYELIQENKDIKFSHEKQKVFLINGNIHIAHCHNSIVVATGNIDISQGSNNILISGKKIEMSHDRGGSIAVARDVIDISFAIDTTVYAPGELKISHSSNVVAYNTENRKISYGNVSTILVEPLFRTEKLFGKSIQAD